MLISPTVTSANKVGLRKFAHPCTRRMRRVHVLPQHQLLRMILNRLGCAALALALPVSLSGCDPSKPAASATPASMALAPAVHAQVPQAPAPPAPAPPPQTAAQQQRVHHLMH